MIPVRKDHETEDLNTSLMMSEALIHNLIGCLSNIQQAKVIVATCLSELSPEAWNEDKQKEYEKLINNFVSYAISLGETMNRVSELTHGMADEAEKAFEEAVEKFNTKIHTIH